VQLQLGWHSSREDVAARAHRTKGVERGKSESVPAVKLEETQERTTLVKREALTSASHPADRPPHTP
jgi:hypothetical protein